jgi:putative ABC transport system permease protein
VGDRVTLMGRELTVAQINAPQGDMDDLTVWCDLATVQQMLDAPGQINAILALECICEPDELGKITEEVRSILPDAQVLEFSSRIIARAEARKRAELAHHQAIESERSHRDQVGQQQRKFAGVLVPVVFAGSGLWMFFLVLGNVRERRAEIGVLRAIGVSEASVLGVFLSKAVIMGVIGAVIGYFIGVMVGAAWGGVTIGSSQFAELFSPRLFVAAVLVAAALCAVAGWLPAMKAAQQDPAVVLRED